MTITIRETGPLATVQDLGRPGYAHLGVPGSGAADRGAMMLANRLVGNTVSAATIECTLGGLTLTTDTDVLMAVTGADTVVRVDGTPVGVAAAVALRAGSELSVDAPSWGCRNYVAVRGGVDVPPVLGSRSTDVLSGLGPAALSAGDRLHVGDDAQDWPEVSSAPPDTDHPRIVVLDCSPGPRRDLVADASMLYGGVWEVTAHSNRVGVRLDRPAGGSGLLEHRDDAGELRSEGIAHGSVQIPPNGRPVVFLADHPVTGGYPVIAVLDAPSLDAAAALVAGMSVRFRDR